MQMRELRCKTPGLVRKGVWTHILAYNLLRTVMAQAAARHGVAPRSLSFTGAMQTLEAFRPLLEFGAAQDAAGRLRLYHDLLDAIATHRVGDRPDRYEPRVKSGDAITTAGGYGGQTSEKPGKKRICTRLVAEKHCPLATPQRRRLGANHCCRYTYDCKKRNGIGCIVARRCVHCSAMQP
jgi:hypothetical protein